MKIAIIAILLMFTLALTSTYHVVWAQGLRVAPLEHRTTLKKNEVKRGFIDISNPYGQTTLTKVSVQAFRQIDDSGNIQFYDDARIRSGITVDVQSLSIQPKEAYRIFFEVDGSRLPQGDVYAAIFFSTMPAGEDKGVEQSVKVGTILSIINQTPGDRRASITKLTMPFISFSRDVAGKYSIKNEGRRGSGFYPEVTISTWPWGDSRQKTSSLVFGGRTRSNDFTVNLGYGFHRVTIEYEGSKKSHFVVVIATWHLMVLSVIVLIVTVEIFRLRARRQQQ